MAEAELRSGQAAQEVESGQPAPQLTVSGVHAESCEDQTTSGNPSCSPRRTPIPAEPRRPALVRPLAPERYKVQMTISADTHEKLRRAQDLLRHSIPDGDPSAVFDRALTALLEKLERTKLGARKRDQAQQSQSKSTAAEPSSSACKADPSGAAKPRNSRHIPAAVKRAVWERDHGSCAFVGKQGRCGATGFLEYHHLVPYAVGGEATTDGISLRCRAHNNHEGELYFRRSDSHGRSNRPNSRNSARAELIE
jgi:hypothetical protein